jgi:hypothetical protein
VNGKPPFNESIDESHRISPLKSDGLLCYLDGQQMETT